MDGKLWVAIVGGLFSIFAILAKQWFEVRSLNVAILAEVQRLYRAIDRQADWWTRLMASGQTSLPLIPLTTPVFDAQAQNIGQINRKIVADVTWFYGYLGFINGLQAVRSQYQDAREFDQQYLRVLQHAVDEFRDPFKAAYKRYKLPDV